MLFSVKIKTNHHGGLRSQRRGDQGHIRVSGCECKKEGGGGGSTSKRLMKRSREGFHRGNLILPELQPVTLIPTSSRLHLPQRRAYFILPIKSDSKSQKPLGGKGDPGQQAKHPVESRRLQAAFMAAKNHVPH